MITYIFPFLAPLYEPQVVAAAVLLMLIGVYLMAYGFPFFTVTMAMTGFLLGCK